MTSAIKAKNKDANRDPLTGEAGAHPVGTGIGTAIGAASGGIAAVAAGAVAGAPMGPLGAAAGAIVGGLVGAAAGKEAAEGINPTAEEAYWQENYANRPYVEGESSFDTYQPAYRHGIDAYSKYQGRKFDEIEPDLSRDWNASSDRPLSWDKAKPATRDAYDRLTNRRNPRA